MAAPELPAYELKANALAESSDSDVLLVNSGMFRPLARNLISLTRRRRRRTNVILILVTGGGDAGEGYWLASCLQNCYSKFTLMVPAWCKSAGTLVAIGANELVMGEIGELGPLDVQLSKPDELLQRQSGLTAAAALETLHEKSYNAFEHFLMSILNSGGAAISTRAATHIAVQLTNGLFGPIYEHLDPMHVGEAGRALTVAKHYGELLNRRSSNLQAGALDQLLTGYAAHDFVIDRSQAERLFQRVRGVNDLETDLLDTISSHTTEPLPYRVDTPPFVAYLNSELPQQAEGSHEAPANVLRIQPNRGVEDHAPGGSDAAGDAANPEVLRPDTAAEPAV